MNVRASTGGCCRIGDGGISSGSLHMGLCSASNAAVVSINSAADTSSAISACDCGVGVDGVALTWLDGNVDASCCVEESSRNDDDSGAVAIDEASDCTCGSSDMGCADKGLLIGSHSRAKRHRDR